MTKAQTAMLNQYNRASCTELEQLYKTCSEEKKSAARHCWAVMHQYNGYDMRYYSRTSYFFTCGFKWLDGKNTHLHVATGRSVYDFIID